MRKKPPTAIDAWRNLLAYHAEAIFRTERELKQAGAIPLSSYDILVELETAHEKKLRLYDLAEACILTKSGISKIVNALEKQGLLRREKSPEDKRGFFAVITEKGSYSVRKAWPVYKKCIENFFASALNDAELKQLEKILPRLRKNLPDTFMQNSCNE